MRPRAVQASTAFVKALKPPTREQVGRGYSRAATAVTERVRQPTTLLNSFDFFP